jgi:hypothetical protein
VIRAVSLAYPTELYSQLPVQLLVVFGLNRETKAGRIKWASRKATRRRRVVRRPWDTRPLPCLGVQAKWPFICERHGRSGLSTATTCGFNRLLDFSGFRITAANRLHTRRRKFAWTTNTTKRRSRFNDPVLQQQRISSSVTLDGVGNSPGHKNRGDGVKYWAIIADTVEGLD